MCVLAVHTRVNACRGYPPSLSALSFQVKVPYTLYSCFLLVILLFLSHPALGLQVHRRPHPSYYIDAGIRTQVLMVVQQTFF